MQKIRMCLPLLLLFGATCVNAQSTFNATGAGSIPDSPGTGPRNYGAPLNMSFAVTGLTSNIANVSVALTMGTAHTFLGDLEVVLISPTGSMHQLFETVDTSTLANGSTDTFGGGPYVFEDAAAVGFCTHVQLAGDPIPGTYRTVQSGAITTTNVNTSIDAVFAGLTPAQANGTWTLRFRDGYVGDTGSVASASLTITGSAPAPEIDVLRGATPVADGLASDDLGNRGILTTQSVTYTIQNSGAVALTLTGTPVVAVTAGTNTQAVSVVTQPSATVAAAGSVQFTVNYQIQAAGVFDFSVSIANDDGNENPYDWTVTGLGVAAPEIDVSRSGAIVSGGTDAVGSRTTGSVSALSYTISNVGTAALAITNPVSLSAQLNCTATVSTPPAATVAAAAGTTLRIDVTPTANGPFSFTVTVINDDSDENPYTFTVTGTGGIGSPSGGKGGGGGGGGCAAETGGTSWLALVGLLGVVALATRVRASRD